MTRVAILQGASGPVGFICQGHAGYAEAGADIVCAAVSILTTTCANALESVAGVKPYVTAREKDGYLKLLLPDEMADGQRHDAQLLIRALGQGMADLQEAYPRYIHFTNQEWRK